MSQNDHGWCREGTPPVTKGQGGQGAIEYRCPAKISLLYLYVLVNKCSLPCSQEQAQDALLPQFTYYREQNE